MSDQNSLGGRVKRYAQVSTAVGGLAARLAGERYLGIDLDRGRHAAELTRALGGLKGPLMKVAQILSTIPDALPREYAQELSQLQANAPAMGWPFVKRRMASELGPDWQAKLGSFEKEAARAASLGQVHRATDKAGRRLACKLQYPDMSSAVEADLKQLKLIFSIYGHYDGAIDTGEIHAELAARLREELDYVREAKHIRLYRHMLAGEAGVHVPEVVPELSTARLLTMTWLEGEPILSAVQAPQEARNAIAMNMFRAWYRPFYGYGVIHGDPHLGNYAVRPDQTLNLLDFGCIRVFPARFVGGVIDLYWALARDDEALAIHAYETWGFRNLSREVIDTLNLWARFLYAPLLENRARRIQESPTGEFGREVAEKVHRDLKRLGGVTPPREFVFMDRAAIGLGAVFMRLKADLNWHELFHDLIRGFDLTALEARQNALLDEIGVPRPE
ncbi:ABC transporter ATP-binding protein [Aliidongia dinghuensis]|uniref:ABC transporter ATP-binding protein n=1 Tax=Aliidongia dinghuensis TaxID=1867774 RepID=A0A8J3E6L0_9PROT|nr:AarF/ABC1/UbiB kinase family protein [Aliidongia dinghuensis]GGF45581.1 ABC transporter ATP-binding protein [Aliidongia dinghuensis]